MDRKPDHIISRIEPLSFSLGCLEGCETNGESPLSNSIRSSPLTTNSLNRRKVKVRVDRDGFRKSWGPTDKDEGNQEFWASIREPYDFIMGTHLIPDSYEVEAKENLCTTAGELELSWDPDDVSPPYVWSFSEFLDQYNELYEWLIQVQLKLYSHSNPPDKNARMAQAEELRRRTFRRKLFVEQGEKVALRYPSSTEEISWRVNYLNNKWEQLLCTLTPSKGRSEEVEVELDLAHEEDLLCCWLSTMEGQIQPITCRLPRGCSLHALQERYKDNQILLKDIEAHGPILKSVIRQYERLSTNDSKKVNAKCLDTAATPTSSNSPSSTHDPPSDAVPVLNPDAPPAKGSNCGVPRRAKSLEKRWHQIYLRSLEWHYYLEGVIATFKEQQQSCSSESEDEPVSKCRRLSSSSFSSSCSLNLPRRAPRPRGGWSEYDLNSSEAGSYIEDDYVCVTGSEIGLARGSESEEESEELMVDDNKKSTNSSSDDNSRGSMVGVNSLIYSSVRMDQMGTLSLDSDINKNKVNGNLSPNPSTPTPTLTNNNKEVDRKNERCFSVSPENSSLTEVNRSPNCGVFDYKHNDTDSEDQISVNENTNLDVSYNEPQSQKKNGIWKVQRKFRTSRICRKMDFADDEEVDHEALQKIIDSAILDPNWLISNISSDSEESILDVLEHPPSFVQESMDTGSEENVSQACKVETEAQEITKEKVVTQVVPCSKESIHRLISDVDELVKEVPIGEPTSLSPRSELKPLPFGMPGASKQRRIKEWLDSQKEEYKSSTIINNLQDSCDASGELTTGESDLESDSSYQDLDVSSTTQRGSVDPLFSSENTPTVEGLPVLPSEPVSKITMRGKKRHQNEQRPWSVSDPNQITRGGNLIQPQPNSGKLASLSKAIHIKSNLSASESALNRMIPFPGTPSPVPNTCSTSHSDPSVANRKCSIVSSSFSPLTPTSPPQSPTVTSSTCLNQLSNVLNGGCVSPLSIAAGSLKKRRAKFRRRSNQFLGRRGDSGSEEIHIIKTTRVKESKSLIYSPYHHSLTKSLSSESECVLGCPRVVKSSSFSGVGHSGAVTSSTERYLSDSSMVSGIPHAKPVDISKIHSIKEKNQISSYSVNASPALSPRQGLNGDQDVTIIPEDVSSLSEQAWDPYQEFKYLSEPYSEDLDRDGARKLLDFGDDYRKYIDSDGSSFLLPPYRRRRSPHHRKMRIHSSYRNLDSDSDLDDLHHVIEESKSQLNAMESVLQKYSNQATLGLDFGELVATTNTNLKCLREILKHLQMEAPDLQGELSDVQSIVQRWETLQTKALERQRQSNQLRQLQRQVKNLRLNLEGISSRSGAFGHPHVLDNPSQFSDKVEEAKALLGEMDNLKVELSSLNLLVHRFTTEIGQGQIPLKDEMAELYRLWDEVYRRVNGEVSRLQSAEATWRLWEEQKIELSKALKQDSDTLKVLDAAIHDGKLTETVTASAHDVAKLLNERRIPGGSKGNFTFQLPKIQSISGERGLRDQNTSNIQLFEVKEDRLSDSGTSGYESCSSDDLSERERRLAYLRRLARDLEASLEPGSKAWTEINMTLAKAEKELIGLQDQCRNLILRTAESLDQGPSPSRFPIVNSKRRSWARDGKSSSRSPRLERLTNSRGVAAAGGCRREWIWRVVRAALPFQAAFLLLLCVAYLLEPSCCDSVNTLNLTFSPQLRYVPGSPPV